MYPRQIDNFTGNFFPRESHGTNVFGILILLITFAILPTQRSSCAEPICKLSRCVLCTNLQQFLARFLALENILQHLNPLLYKDNLYLACKKVKTNILLFNGMVQSHISTVAMLILFIRGAINYDRMNPLAKILSHQHR